MARPGCLIDTTARLVIDSSAAINLTATGRAVEIIRALPNEIVAVDTIAVELDYGRRRGRPHADLFDELVEAGQIKIVELNSQAAEHFEDLVIGPAVDTLDDGEAATVAYAAACDAMPIVDERKATRICHTKFPNIAIGCTTDLFAHPNVERALGRDGLSDAVFKALKEARMRVLPHHIDWVVELIGPEQVASCSSFPRSIRRGI